MKKTISMSNKVFNILFRIITCLISILGIYCVYICQPENYMSIFVKLSFVSLFLSLFLTIINCIFNYFRFGEFEILKSIFSNIFLALFLVFNLVVLILYPDNEWLRILILTLWKSKLFFIVIAFLNDIIEIEIV